jgi:hypothetical protein
MSNYTQMTVEFWFDFGAGNPFWAYLFSFGEEVGGVKTSGLDYCPYADGNYQNSDFRDGSGFCLRQREFRPPWHTATTTHRGPREQRLCFYNGASLVST